MVDVYAQLKLLSEVVPEAASPNSPAHPENHAQSIRENVTALSLAVDLLFDHGVPNIREKSTLLTLLEKADLISKASDYMSGSTVMNTAHGRICN